MWQQVEFALRASLMRVLTKVAVLLPAVTALVLAVLAFALIGALVALVLRRVLAAVHFDERVRSGSPSVIFDWTALRSPATLLSRIVFWGFVLAGTVIGVAAFAAAYSDTEEIASAMFPYLAHSVGAVFILLAGTVAARFLARSVLIGAVNMQLQYARLLSQGVKWMVLVLAVAMALDHLGIGGVIVELAFGIMFGGIVLTLALAIGLRSPEIVTRSLEPDAPRTSAEPTGSTGPKLHHF